MKTDHVAENILISLLAVNGWTVDRVFPLMEQFRAAGLLDFSAVSELPLKLIAERLAHAGYNRGEYMNLLMSRRVLSLATSLSGAELDRLTRCLLKGQINEVSSTLQRINSVGPIV